jgi:hypothetical protein
MIATWGLVLVSRVTAPPYGLAIIRLPDFKGNPGEADIVRHLSVR